MEKKWNREELMVATKMENLCLADGSLFEAGVGEAYRDFQENGCSYEWVKETLPEAAKQAYTHNSLYGCFNQSLQGYFQTLEKLYYALDGCYVELPLVAA